MLNTEERRGYGALIALGALLGVVAGMVAMSITYWDLTAEVVAFFACVLLGALVAWPLAHFESRVWAARRRSRDEP